MPALDPETRERWRDMVVVDRDAATVGTISTFYLDRASGLPTWALVHTGWFGDRHTFVPLTHAVEVGGEIQLPYPKALVQQAPRVDPATELSADDELHLYGHYGLHDHYGAVAERPPGDGRADARGEDASAPPAPPAAASASAPPRPAVRPDPPATPLEPGATVVRSEEELRVGVRTVLRRLRLRKYVVTEYVTRTIPIRREEVRLEELPPGSPASADPPTPDGPGDEPSLELVLHREEPVIQTRVVPIERVRVVKHVVTEHRTFSEQLRKEQVELQQEPPATSGP
jgi:uncharacterized protein (TIGR02271 family)